MALMNTSFSIKIIPYTLFLIILFGGCSSLSAPQHPMTKEEILDYYIDYFSSRKCLSGKYSEYSFSYQDTVFHCGHINNKDSLYFEDEYSQLSVISFSRNPKDAVYSSKRLPTYVIEKNNILFLPVDEIWGPGHSSVEQILRNRGHVFASEKDDLLSLMLASYSGSDIEKGTRIYFLRSNPKKHKIIQSSIALPFHAPPKFKGVNHIHREYKANSIVELPHYQ